MVPLSFCSQYFFHRDSSQPNSLSLIIKNDLMRDRQTFEELNIAINEYIYFYNHERYQKRLNGLSPKEYRAKAA